MLWFGTAVPSDAQKLFLLCLKLLPCKDALVHQPLQLHDFIRNRWGVFVGLIVGLGEVLNIAT